MRFSESTKYQRQSRHLNFRENEWANLARTEKMTDPETGETLEDEEIIEDTPLLINLKVSNLSMDSRKRKRRIECQSKINFDFAGMWLSSIG